ncbi:MAG: hypothetical protein LBP51_04570, partial [Deferribacteraceae bacterium]|nr:hypothetical protein [Deferribacteraceae bacterium]
MLKIFALMIFIMLPFISSACTVQAEIVDIGGFYRGSSFLLKLSSQVGAGSYEINWQARGFTIPAAKDELWTQVLIPLDYSKSGDFELSVKAEGCEELKEVITVNEK